MYSSTFRELSQEYTGTAKVRISLAISLPKFHDGAFALQFLSVSSHRTVDTLRKGVDNNPGDVG